MKQIGLIVAGLILSMAAFAQDSGEIPVELTTPGKKGKLDVDIKRGSITVVGTSRSDVLVKYSTRMPKDCKDCDEPRADGLKRVAGASTDLEVSQQNNVVKVNSDSWARGVDLTIEVPTTFDLKLDGYNGGDISVKNIKGELDLDNYNGKITAENISGSVIAETYNGRILVTFDAITPGAAMAYSTYNGDIDLTFPASFKGKLKMKTRRGEILSGFDMEIIKTEPIKKENKNGISKVYLDDMVNATIGNGTTEFRMENYNGDIIIRKK